MLGIQTQAADQVDGLLSSYAPDRGGEFPIPPWAINQANVAQGPGLLKLVYFKAKKSEQIESVILRTGSSGFASPTLFRVGIYLIDPTVAGPGPGTLVASSANNTSGSGTGNAGSVASANTEIVRALSSTFSTVAGYQYAVGILGVASAGNANFNGLFLADSYWSNRADAQCPARLAGNLVSQTDLPSTFDGGDVQNTANVPGLFLKQYIPAA